MSFLETGEARCASLPPTVRLANEFPVGNTGGALAKIGRKEAKSPLFRLPIAPALNLEHNMLGVSLDKVELPGA